MLDFLTKYAEAGVLGFCALGVLLAVLLMIGIKKVDIGEQRNISDLDIIERQTMAITYL